MQESSQSNRKRGKTVDLNVCSDGVFQESSFALNTLVDLIPGKFFVRDRQKCGFVVAPNGAGYNAILLTVTMILTRIDGMNGDFL